MRILVCGSRHLTDWKIVDDALFDLTGLRDLYNFGTIIHGNARGADSHGANWGYRMGWEVKAYPADWDKYGNAAGPIRNKQMLDEGKPDIVLAFLAPDSRGTKNMISQAEKAGIPIRIINIGGRT